MRTGLIAAALAASLQPAAAQRVEAPECCLTLLLPVGAHSVALGRALGALATEDAVFANPAGLAPLVRPRFTVHHASILEGQQATALSLLLTPEVLGAAALTYHLLDYGEVPAVDEFGNTTGVLNTREHLLVGTVATGLGAGLSGGLSYKLYALRIGCSGRCPGAGEVDATTHAVDLGAQYALRDGRTARFGLALTDAGFPLQVVNAEQADPLPTRLRLAAAAEVWRWIRAARPGSRPEVEPPDSSLQVWLLGELERPLRTGPEGALSVGVEAIVGDLLAVRAGYRTGDGIGTGLAIGLGVDFDRYRLAVARAFTSSTLEPGREPLYVTFGIGL